MFQNKSNNQYSLYGTTAEEGNKIQVRDNTEKLWFWGYFGVLWLRQEQNE